MKRAVDKKERLYGAHKAVYVGTMPMDLDDNKSQDGKQQSAPVITHDHMANCFGQAHKLNQQPMKVYIAVSASAVTVLARKTHTSLHKTPISQVLYTGLLRSDASKFAYISVDPLTRVVLCHMFMIKEAALALPKMIASAFEGHKQAAVSTSPSTESSDVDEPERSPTALRSKKSLEALRVLKRKSGSDIDVSKTMASFVASYLGCIAVERASGMPVVEDALTRLRDQQNERHQQGKRRRSGHGSKLSGDTVVLSVDEDELRVFEQGSATLRRKIYLRDITYVTAGHASKKRDFMAVIAADTRLNRKQCHFFEVQRAKAETICKAIFAALEVLQQQREEEQAAFASPPASPPQRARADTLAFLPKVLLDKKLSRETLRPLKQLGTGVYGKVFLADADMPDGSVVQRAVKMLRRKCTHEDRKNFLQECATMQHLQGGPNLVKFLGVAVEQKPYLCVLEFMQYGDLGAALETCKERGFTLNLREQLCFVKQIVAGMEYITSKGYVHLDLAARNCLLHRKNVVKIADFGLTRRHDKGKDYWTMTEKLRLAVKWLPPEALIIKLFSERTDIWAFGVTIWEIFSYGEKPFLDYKVPEIPQLVREGLRLSRPEACPQDVFDFVMNRIWVEEPKQRITFSEAKGVIEEFYGKVKDHHAERDVGKLLNSKLSRDIHRLSMSVKRKSMRAKTKSPLAGAASDGERRLSAATTGDDGHLGTSPPSDGSASPGSIKRKNWVRLSQVKNRRLSVSLSDDDRPKRGSLAAKPEQKSPLGGTVTGSTKRNSSPPSSSSGDAAAETTVATAEGQAVATDSLAASENESTSEPAQGDDRKTAEDQSQPVALQREGAKEDEEEEEEGGSDSHQERSVESTPTHLDSSMGDGDQDTSLGAVITMEGYTIREGEEPSFVPDDSDEDEGADDGEDGDVDDGSSVGSSVVSSPVQRTAGSELSAETLEEEQELDKDDKASAQPSTEADIAGMHGSISAEALDNGGEQAKVAAGTSSGPNDAVDNAGVPATGPDTAGSTSTRPETAEQTVEEAPADSSEQQANTGQAGAMSAEEQEAARLERYRRLGLVSDDTAEQQQEEQQRSRIYRALNPTALYSGQRADTAAASQGLRAGSLASFTPGEEEYAADGPATSGVPSISVMADDMDADDQPGDVSFDDIADEDEDDEDDEDDDDLDLSNLPGFGDLQEILERNRKKREEQHQARQQALRAEYQEVKAKKVEAQETLLREIESIKAKERQRQEQEKEVVFKEAQRRLGDLQFSFTFDSEA